jgi:uncharacterized protein
MVGRILLPTSRTALSFTRNMSSSPTKHLFAIYAPDYTEPGTLDRRISAREEHLKGIHRLRSSGIASTCSLAVVVPPTMTTFFFCAEFGGPLLAPELVDEKDRKKMTGSLMFFEAESIEEVRKIVQSDIYYTSGVVRHPLSLDPSPIDLTL